MEHHAEVMARLGKPFTIEWFDAGHGCNTSWGRTGIPGMGQNLLRLRNERLTHSRNAQAVLAPIVK
jgi:hypothetical protein